MTSPHAWRRQALGQTNAVRHPLAVNVGRVVRATLEAGAIVGFFVFCAALVILASDLGAR